MNQSNKRPIVFVIGAVLLYMVLLTSAMSLGLQARYMSSSAGEDSARVARFEFVTASTSDVEVMDISEISAPGESVVYQFEVANHGETGVCEVAQRYTVTVQVDGNMPLICTLTKNEGEQATSMQIFSVENQTLSLGGEFSASVTGRDVYSLMVEWPQEYNGVKYNGAEYANGLALGKVTVTVVSQQID